MDTSMYTEILKQCVQNCMQCLTRMTRVESHNDCPNCCIECVQVCEITSNAIVQQSRFVEKFMELCADVCEWTAQQCAEHPFGECQACALTCRKCVKMMRMATAKNSPQSKAENDIEKTNWFG